MDDSIIDIGNGDISDKVTIKVKLSDEEYQDLVIDWSERSGRFKGQQIINQLSSIIGIPSNYICYVGFPFENEESYFIQNIERKDFNAELYNYPDDDYLTRFSKENCKERLHNGDCFAILTELFYELADFYFRITLYSPVSFTDNDCTRRYCHYSNTRAFINRQIAIATNAELLVEIRSKIPPFAQLADQEVTLEVYRLRQNILRDFNIKPFLYWSWCRVTEDGYRNVRVINVNPLYSRTRG